MQQQKRLREEKEAQGAKGGWSSKRQHGGYSQGVVVKHGDRPRTPRDESWKAWKRETAARAWNQRMADRGTDTDDAQRSDKSGGKGKNRQKREGFHQGYRRLAPIDGVMPK